MFLQRCLWQAGTGTGQYSVSVAVREGGEVVVLSMVVTDMMGEMDQDMLSLYTPLTPSLTDSSHHTPLSAN